MMITSVIHNCMYSFHVLHVENQVPVNGESVVADYDLKLGNIDVDLDGLGPLQVNQ